MKLGYMKTSIINRAGGSKSTRNNYADNIGAAARYRKNIKKYKQSITGSCIGVQAEELDRLRRTWQQAGRSLKDFNRLGTMKVREILKGY